MWTDLVTDHTLQLGDGRSVAWTQSGDPEGRPVLRVPGTPGTRWSVRADQQPWLDRHLLVITTERPGFGVSSPLAGRGFAEHADDLAAILDQLGIDRVPVYGASGAAPHILALCARHPGRVSAATNLAGAAPLTDAEAENVIPNNRQARMLAVEGDRHALEALLNPIRQAMVDDTLAAFGDIMSTAPPDDLEIMSDPTWQEAFVRATREALAQGVAGWVDETLALDNRWDDVDLGAVQASVLWRHAPDDRNAPISAARRIVDALPNCRLEEWPGGGHLAAYHREGDVLDELLRRAAA
jgi:pimeloyl-ACP methyl ester carboxylesterase